MYLAVSPVKIWNLGLEKLATEGNPPTLRYRKFSLNLESKIYVALYSEMVQKSLPK